MTKVWHAKNPTFGLTEQRFPDDYELIAYVHCDNPDDAFRLTNSIDRPWWDNEEVKVVKMTRSTSVGDVVEWDGKVFLCENAGWKRL